MKGKKRKRNSPTHSPVAPSPKGPSKSSPPLLPYQLRSSTKASKYSSTNSSPFSRMDNLDSFEADLEDVLHELPTAEEAEALLRDDDVVAVSDPDSPTAAVKSAIEARIAENLDMLDSSLISQPVSNTDSNKDASALPTLPQQALPKKPQPLFPEGLPLPWAPKPSQAANDTQTRNLSKSNTTYATKTKSPPKARVVVEHILFVYATWTNKAPINASDWGIVDSHLLGMEIQQDPSEPLIRIANSGYDAAHRCGFIACRDLASADWCKRTIHGIGGPQFGAKGAFRAWAKGEQPEARLCRLFFPSRFDSLTDDTLMTLLKKHNPSLGQGTLLLKGVDDVQGGRALFVEFDIESYTFVKSKGYKVEFSMMDIDCQLYIPPKRVVSKGPGVSGISKLANLPHPPPQAQTQKSNSNAASTDSNVNLASSKLQEKTSGSSVSVPSVSLASSAPASVSTPSLLSSLSKGAHRGDPRLSQRAQPPLAFKTAPTPVTVAQGKRGRPESASAIDGAKKSNSN